MSARDICYGLVFAVSAAIEVWVVDWGWAALDAAALLLLCTDAICTAIREAAKR